MIKYGLGCFTARKKTEVGKSTQNSLSRLLYYNSKHDCGAITAFRVYNDCGFLRDRKGNILDGTKDIKTGIKREFKPVNPKSVPKKNSRKVNNRRNKALLFDITEKNYGYIKVIGKYKEGGVLVTEVSYIVIDLDDTGKLKKDLITLGKKYNQDSVLFIEKGAIGNVNKSARAILIGTNNCKNNSIPIGKTQTLGSSEIGKTSQEVITKIGNREFAFKWLDIEEGEIATTAFQDKLSRWEASHFSSEIGR